MTDKIEFVVSEVIANSTTVFCPSYISDLVESALAGPVLLDPISLYDTKYYLAQSKAGNGSTMALHTDVDRETAVNNVICNLGQLELGPLGTRKPDLKLKGRRIDHAAVVGSPYNLPQVDVAVEFSREEGHRFVSAFLERQK